MSFNTRTNFKFIFLNLWYIYVSYLQNWSVQVWSTRQSRKKTNVCLLYHLHLRIYFWNCGVSAAIVKSCQLPERTCCWSLTETAAFRSESASITLAYGFRACSLDRNVLLMCSLTQCVEIVSAGTCDFTASITSLGEFYSISWSSVKPNDFPHCKK